MTARQHERQYADIRTHLRTDHAVTVTATVTLATFLRHRRLHAAGADHTHDRRPECKTGTCPCRATH
jgi:hypothetical protein